MMIPLPLESPDHEQRLNDVLLTYLESRQAGVEPDRERLLKSHPDLGPELKEFFESQDQIERLVVGARHSVQTCQVLRPPAEVESDIGRLGDYRLLKEVGRGGMGVVYEAEQVSLRRRVALKVLPFAAAVDPRQLQRFKNEALAAAHLHHEHIVPVYAVGEERGVHYYAMQFIEGQSLATLIRELREPTTDKFVDAAAKEVTTNTANVTAAISTTAAADNRSYFHWVAQLGLQIARALEYAHSMGIVHRDIKPANLMLDPRGHVWIADFGLAQFATEGNVTITGEMVGTFRYASPEQILARHGVTDHRTDVYSLGATLYELMTLQPLFDGRDRNEILVQIANHDPRRPGLLRPNIPRELDTIVLKSLRKEASDRYATARDLAEDLQRFLDHRPILARPPTVAERMWKFARRHPAVFGTATLILVLLSVGSLISALMIRAEQERTKFAQWKAEQAYQSERKRSKEAEARFHLARRSVDEMFRISQEELADRPGLEALRKRMLWSVLAFYQEFLEQRRDDVNLQADLLDAKQRVEKILGDLAVLRAASQLYLLNQPEVLDDLRVSDEQRSKVKQFCERVGQEWWQSFDDMGRLPPSERERQAIARARIYEAEVSLLLSAEQKRRLDQIGLQRSGPGAFAEPDVISRLQLTDEQRKQIRMIEVELHVAWIRNPHRRNTDSKQPSADERILALLTEDQRSKWNAMTGLPIAAPSLPVSVSPAPATHPKSPVE